LEEIFPDNIKPISLGGTAINLLRAISRKVPKLGDARALFLAECKDADGAPIPISFSHADRIWKALKAEETEEAVEVDKVNKGRNSSAASVGIAQQRSSGLKKTPTKVQQVSLFVSVSLFRTK